MNEEQFACLVKNRKARWLRGLGETSRWAELHPRQLTRPPRTPLDSVLAKAARNLRQREAAAAAWQRIAQPEWLAETSVLAVEEPPGAGRTVVVGASSSTVCYELRRRKTKLERQLARLVTGVHRVRFEITERSGAGV